MDKVSVIIPVYNTNKELLKRCIQSVINQSYENIEIILIDDGSNEDVATFCDSFSKMDSRIRIYHQANQGVSSARNNGIKKSTGVYIAFVDADDFINFNYIERLIKTANEDNSDIVFTSCNKIYGKKIEPQKIYKVKNNESLRYNKIDKQFSQYNLDLMGTVWGKLYKKELIKNKKFNNELCFGEDILFNFEVFNNSINYSYLDEHLYQYFVNQDSAIRKFNSQTILLYDKTISKISDCLTFEKNHEKINTFLLFVCTFYRVIITNYICNPCNKNTYKNKIAEMKRIRNSKTYKNAIESANLNSLRISRRISIFLSKMKMFNTLYFLIKLRNFQCKIYSKGEG